MNKIINWIKENKYLILILILGLILRIKYLTINQAVWWDEAEYLAMAKDWALGVPWDFHFVRPILFSLIAAGQYSLGITSELPLRILELIISMIGIYFIYLLGKEFFNKETGLIAAFISSVFYLNLFYTARLLVDLPSAILWLIATYYFWKWYKTKSRKYIYITSIILALGILLRLPTGLLVISIILFLLITEKLNWLKSKDIWYSAILGFLIMLPYFIWFYLKFDKIPIIGAAEYYTTANQVPYYLNILPTVLDTPLAKVHVLLIALIIGIAILLYNAFKKENKIKDNKELIFLILWCIPALYYFLRLMIAEDRYLFAIYPAFFIIIGFAIFYIYEIIKKFHKVIGIIFIILILLFTGFYHISYGDQLIKFKANSYQEFKTAGEWIKQNSNPSDIIICDGIPQNTYYSERETKRYPSTEEAFIKLIKEIKPKYMIVTILEKSPEWVYSWPQNNQDKIQPLIGFTDQNKQPILIIFEFKN